MGWLYYSSRISYIWGAILYQWASSIFFIIVNEHTKYLSAIWYLIGSALFALSDVFGILQTEGFNKIMNCTFCFADSILVIGSIFFFPPLGKVIVGNWLFEIAGWLNLINHSIKFKQLWDNPTPNWRIDLISRIFNCIGTVTFIIGNILLINNSVRNFHAGFVFFTIGSVGFTLGGTFSFVDKQKIVQNFKKVQNNTQSNVNDQNSKHQIKA